MDDMGPRRHSYPGIETPRNSSVDDPSVIDLQEITRGSSAGLVSGIASYQSGRDVDPRNNEYSTSDFNKEVDDIQRAHMAELPTSPLPNARQERSSEDDSCHGPDPTGSKSPPLTEGIVGTHVHPPSPSTNLTRPRDPTYPLAPQANRRAPPFPLLPQSDDIKAGTHHDPVAIPPPAEGQPTAPKIRNPRRRRQFMRWVKKKFTGPWSLASPHDPSHGKNAAKRAVNQGL